jgi:hypothetical protein
MIMAMRASIPLSRMMRSSPLASPAVTVIKSLRFVPAGNKKERDRVDPLFVIPTKNLIAI